MLIQTAFLSDILVSQFVSDVNGTNRANSDNDRNLLNYS